MVLSRKSTLIFYCTWANIIKLLMVNTFLIIFFLLYYIIFFFYNNFHEISLEIAHYNCLPNHLGKGLECLPDLQFVGICTVHKSSDDSSVEVPMKSNVRQLWTSRSVCVRRPCWKLINIS